MCELSRIFTVSNCQEEGTTEISRGRQIDPDARTAVATGSDEEEGGGA